MSQSSSFQEGDIVVLKSGGPLMTVQGSADLITCIWYNVPKSEFIRSEFWPTSLQPAPQDVILPVIGGGN